MLEEKLLIHTRKVEPATLEVEVINDLERFNAIAAEWDELVDRSGFERLFVSHAWLRTWWEAFGGIRELYVLTVRSGQQLIGAAPMMRSNKGIYGVRLKSIESIYNPHTPRFDVIVEKDEEHEHGRLADRPILRHETEELVLERSGLS